LSYRSAPCAIRYTKCREHAQSSSPTMIKHDGSGRNERRAMAQLARGDGGVHRGTTGKECGGKKRTMKWADRITKNPQGPQNGGPTGRGRETSCDRVEPHCDGHPAGVLGTTGRSSSRARGSGDAVALRRPAFGARGARRKNGASGERESRLCGEKGQNGCERANVNPIRMFKRRRLGQDGVPWRWMA
jgi:hypothetical protein